MRRRYCPVCRQIFEDNRAADEYIEASCRSAGYGQDDEQRDCSKNFWVKLFMPKEKTDDRKQQ